MQYERGKYQLIYGFSGKRREHDKGKQGANKGRRGINDEYLN
jgi:hypothetical protein